MILPARVQRYSPVGLSMRLFVVLVALTLTGSRVVAMAWPQPAPAIPLSASR